jgi:hypothetical protein
METSPGQPVLIEGEDYYYENGLMVFTAGYHLRRGYCCERACRHCPYGYSVEKADLDAQPKEAHS